MNKSSDLANLLAPEEKMELTATDICQIVRVCRENEVSDFEFGSLKVSLRASQLVDAEKPIPPHSTEKPILEEVDKSHKQEEAFLLSETVVTREEELSTLIATDPEKYEDLIASGDLVDAPKDDK